MAKTLVRIPQVFRVTKFEVVKDGERNRFFYKGFVFDRIAAGCFASEVTDHEVQVSVYRKVAKCQDSRIVGMSLVHHKNLYVTHHEGHDDPYRLSQKMKGVLLPAETHLTASLFTVGDILLIAGHKNDITRKYLKKHAER